MSRGRSQPSHCGGGEQHFLPKIGVLIFSTIGDIFVKIGRIFGILGNIFENLGRFFEMLAKCCEYLGHFVLLLEFCAFLGNFENV